MIHPCKHCPFLRANRHKLNPQTAQELIEGLEKNKLVLCQETVDFFTHDEDEPEGEPCIGSAIYLEKSEKNGIVSNPIYKRVMALSANAVNLNAAVYESKVEMLNG